MTAAPLNEDHRRAYLAEIYRLRQLVIDSADMLGEFVEPALVAVCQDSTDENTDQRHALLILREVLAELRASGRPTVAP